jgi:O-antigen/teichoic acid export membrane protein
VWRRVVRDSLTLSAGVAALVGLQLAYRYLAVRELSVADYGRVALLLSIFYGASVVGAYGIPATVSRLAARTHGRDNDRNLLAAATRAIAVPTLLASTVMAVATWLVTRSPADTAVAFAGIAPITWAGIYRGYIRGKGMVWQSATVQWLNIAVQTALLLALIGLDVGVGIGWVLGSFYVGNFCALAVAYVWRRRAMKRATLAPADQDDPEATVKRILGFTVWLSLANLAVLLLTVFPRLFLVQFSYREVAIFDLALLVYTIPQRLRASFLLALLPIAAVEQKKGTRITVPDNRDLVAVTCCVLAVDALLWGTHAFRIFLDSVGMSAYAGAEPLLLIILLAAPAELFFGINSGLLQAYGRSRQLAFVSVGVLGLCVAAAAGAIWLGPKYLAAVLAAAYWMLHLATRRMLTDCGVEERPVLLQTVFCRLRRDLVRLDDALPKAESL